MEVVRSARNPRLRLPGGIAVGALAYLMRSQGEWTDGIAFAVLGVNAFTPFAERVLASGSGRVPVGTTASVGGGPASLQHLPDLLRIAMLFGLLTLDWHGTGTNASPRPEDVTKSLLQELRDGGYGEQVPFSVQDAAQVAGTTPGALKVRAHRAYETLRRALGLKGGAP